MGRLFLALGFGAALSIFFAGGQEGGFSAGGLSGVLHEGAQLVLSVKNRIFRNLG